MKGVCYIFVFSLQRLVAMALWTVYTDLIRKHVFFQKDHFLKKNQCLSYDSCKLFNDEFQYHIDVDQIARLYLLFGQAWSDMENLIPGNKMGLVKIDLHLNFSVFIL